ncbi:hypothetical protein PROFUN_16058 [Planoprotostelium fungivorum]|uniref:Stress-response A/B barrel domain-containing protein n=1 Tax=Planoprotostelium fungivorum TaxID=1890364 RepID=A0A2P6MXJ4_9EUKA|nr:hypothetical protein PROFUN_16058 [Planoprotostelium fungivorum]
MRAFVLLSLFALVVLSQTTSSTEEISSSSLASETQAINSTSVEGQKLFHHVITFRYKWGVTRAQVDSVTKAYLALNDLAVRDGRKYIRIVGGKTISTEGVKDRFRNGFILTFTSADDREHFGCCEKAHQDFGNFMGQYVESKGYNVGFDFQEEGNAPWLTRTSNSSRLFHHDITFRYKDNVTQAQIDSVTQAYLSLNDKAVRNGRKYINIVGGRTISTEGVKDNFRNGFILTFKKLDDLVHFRCCEKAHQQFGDFMGQYVTSTGYNVGFDFEEQF